MRTWIAFIKGPTGQIWEGTASIATGSEAEYKARNFAQMAFCRELVGPLIKSPPVVGLWDAARESGFECVSFELPAERVG